MEHVLNAFRSMRIVKHVMNLRVLFVSQTTHCKIFPVSIKTIRIIHASLL
jgi:hypothetical protein